MDDKQLQPQMPEANPPEKPSDALDALKARVESSDTMPHLESVDQAIQMPSHTEDSADESTQHDVANVSDAEQQAQSDHTPEVDSLEDHDVPEAPVSPQQSEQNVAPTTIEAAQDLSSPTEAMQQGSEQPMTQGQSDVTEQPSSVPEAGLSSSSATSTETYTKQKNTGFAFNKETISIAGMTFPTKILMYVGLGIVGLLLLLGITALIGSFTSGPKTEVETGATTPQMQVRVQSPDTGSFSPLIDNENVTAPITLQFDTRLELPRATGDYRIISYEWDLNGDGVFSSLEGDSSVVTYEYRDMGPNNGLYDIGVRIEKEILSASTGYEIGEVITETYGVGSSKGGFSFRITSEKPYVEVRTFPDVLEGVAPFEVEFDATRSSSKNGIEAVRWDFNGDKIPDQEGLEVSYTFTNPGISDVTVVVEDSEGIISTKTFEVEVIEALLPQPALQATPLTGTAPLKVDFDASGSTSEDGRIIEYVWDFDDDTQPARGEKVTHTFEKPGRYFVSLEVKTDKGSTNSVSEVIDVSTALGSPTARIDAKGEGSDLKQVTGTQGKTIEGRIPFTVSFDGRVSQDPEGDIVSWKWDFDGDKTLDDSGDQVSTVYKTPGNYLVTLEVEDSVGNKSEATMTIIARADEFTVDVVADPVVAVAPTFVAFDASGSTYAGGGKIASFEWDFGDGSPKQLRTGTASHEYTKFGTYEAEVTVRTTDGKSKKGSIIITMLQQPLTPVIEVSSEEGVAPFTIDFDAGSSEGDIVSYRWNFGDGATATGSSASHTFTNPGRYDVTLVVQDKSGTSQQARKTVRILE